MPTIVRWSTDSKYLVFSDNHISIYSILQSSSSNDSLSESPIVAKIKSKSRINCGVCMKIKVPNRTTESKITATEKVETSTSQLDTYPSQTHEIDVVVYGGEDKILRIADISTGQILLNLATKHQLRIKDMAGLPLLGQFVTCSSEGLIQLWDIGKLADLIDFQELSVTKELTKLISIEECETAIIGHYDCKCRLTCIAFINGDTGEDKRQEIEKKRKEKQDLEIKLDEMPESDYEVEMNKGGSYNGGGGGKGRNQVLVSFDLDDSIQISSSLNQKVKSNDKMKKKMKISRGIKSEKSIEILKKKSKKFKKPKLFIDKN